MASLDQAVEIFLLLNRSTLVFLEFGLEMAAPHFDAYLSPEPHSSHGSPDLSLVQGGHKGVHNLYEVLEGPGLDSPDLSLADTPQAKVTQSFVRAPGRPKDLCVARDDPVPDRS